MIEYNVIQHRVSPLQSSAAGASTFLGIECYHISSDGVIASADMEGFVAFPSSYSTT